MSAEALLHRLADGEPHSGQALAREFGVTRAAVWKRVARLRRWGLEIEAVPGRGYRLERPVELLERDAVAARIASGGRVAIGRLDVFTEIESTNRYLVERPAPRPGALDVCLAEFQRAGRGRRGRRWHAPLGSGLCLSVGWHFAETPPQLAALTLAAGAEVRRVLERTAGVATQLKWPNDLVWDGRKLGGLLLELAAEAHGGCHVVVGLGLNVALPREWLARVSDWPGGAADLALATAGAPPARAELAAALIEALGCLLDTYQREGFAPYREAWSRADHLEGKLVTLHASTGDAEGIARGIEPDGALRIEAADGSIHRVVSGDVSVRTPP